MFPEKIGGRYARLDVPPGDRPLVDLDLLFAGPGVLGRVAARHQAGNYHWDEMKMVPARRQLRRMPRWLYIYHGVFGTMDGW